MKQRPPLMTKRRHLQRNQMVNFFYLTERTEITEILYEFLRGKFI